MTTKRKPWTARRIHLWIAVILAIPMILIAVSGILIAMRSVTTLQVPMSWLGAEAVPDHLPMTAYLEMPGGAAWIGNAQGLTRIQDGKVQRIEAFNGQEIVGLARLPERPTPVVATKMAVWTEQGGVWQTGPRGRVRQLSTLPEGQVLTIAGGRGEMAAGRALVTTDGVEWKVYGRAMKANKALPPLEHPSVSLHQWMRELHSGAYFLGKGPGEMVWSNLFGWVLTLLSLTGLWMWWQLERRKARERAGTSLPLGAKE
jgi:hypothetical protein